MTATEELELLRTILSLDQTLFTVQRDVSCSNDNIRVDCFASKGVDSPGLVKITNLVASVLKYRRGIHGLTMSNREDAGRNLAAALSKKLELDLKHERVR